MVEKPLGALTPWAGAGCKRLRVETCVTSREGSITFRVCVQKKQFATDFLKFCWLFEQV